MKTYKYKLVVSDRDTIVLIYDDVPVIHEKELPEITYNDDSTCAVVKTHEMVYGTTKVVEISGNVLYHTLIEYKK